MDVKIPLLPTQRVSAIVDHSESGWLIENLWLESACGIIGGQPKCCKSWLGLDMAISVASGSPCLKKFNVVVKGTALVFMAEDRVEEVKKRVENIAKSRNLSIDNLDLHLITAPAVRLDSEDDCRKLDATLTNLKPRILLLDPLVRLHRLDENSAREISGLLGYLRELERKHKVAIVLTHHASKRAHARPGQGLRGSSDLHAFGDSNIYISKRGNDLEISVEHRSASSIDPFALRLVTEPHVHLQVLSKQTSPEVSSGIDVRVLSVLASSSNPINRSALRAELRVNNQRLGQALSELIAKNAISTSAEGYALCQ